MELVEAFDLRRLRQAEAPEELRHRDAGLLLALQHAGSGQRRNVDRVEVAQPAEDDEAVAPVELLPAQAPVEGHGAPLMVAADVQVVERRAAEAGAILRAVVA